MKNFFVLAFLALTLFTCSASATSYYVSQSLGNDTYPGTSTAKPFKTLARVAALTGLRGGDAIYLRRGDTWHEQLNVPGSGTSTSSRLMIDAYGPGSAPVIDGADTVSGFSLIAPDTYQVRRSETTYKVFVDLAYSASTPLKKLSNLLATILTPGSFYSDADTLYVHLADGSNPSSHVIEASGSSHAYGVLSLDRSYVTVQNLWIVRTTNSGVAFILDYSNVSGTSGNQNNTINRLTIHNSGSSAPLYYGFDGGILVRGNGSSGSMGLTGWTITHNTIGRLDSPIGLNYNIGGIELRGVTGAMIDTNIVQTGTAMGIQERPYGKAACCSTNKIMYNWLSNNEGNISGQSPNEQVVSNIIVNSRGFGIQVHGNALVSGNSMTHLGKSTDGTLYNGIDGYDSPNTLYANNSITDVWGCSLTIEGASTGVVVDGGTYNSNDASGCALYVTATAQSVKFTGTAKWFVNPSVAKPFGYLLTSVGDRINRYSKEQFLALTK